jgi:hypothetical protein
MVRSYVQSLDRLHKSLTRLHTVTPKTLWILAGSESDGAAVIRGSALANQHGGSRYCGIERQKREVSGVKYFVRL